VRNGAQINPSTLNGEKLVMIGVLKGAVALSR